MKAVPFEEDMIQVQLDGRKVIVSGPKGELERDFSDLGVNIEKRDKEIVVFNHFPRKREKSFVGTTAGHISNMLKGVSEGFTYTLRVMTSHFPASVEIKNENLIVSNLHGAKGTKIIPFSEGVNVKIKENEINISGISLEAVAQMSARIVQTCRWRGKRAKSPLVFQDGIYLISKS